MDVWPWGEIKIWAEVEEEREREEEEEELKKRMKYSSFVPVNNLS